MTLKDLSPEAKESLFHLFEMRGEILIHVHLSESAKQWHRQVYWMQDHDAVYYCELD